MSCRPKSLSVAITGSSGIRVALRFLEVARDLGLEIYGIIVSNNAIKVAEVEEDIDSNALLNRLREFAPVYREYDFESPLASSSNQPDSMVIVPASMKTISSIANGIQDNLITRAALSMLRLGRRLVVVPRETPLGAAELESLYRLSSRGVLVVPMCLSFYIRPRGLDDLVDFVVGKIFDVLGFRLNIYRRWGEGSFEPTSS
jgi:4-hydroxy-3-polyprenylbenzoate decarboxylase